MKPFDFHLFFAYGMKRNIVELEHLVPPVLELGPGNTPCRMSDLTLDWPGWNGETMPIPHADESVGSVLAFHFFEHFTGARAIELLRECERVIMPGGSLNIVVPHHSCSLAVEDLDHKSFWTEDTWRILMRNVRYDKNRERPWRFNIGFNAIVGVNERNLAVMTQLVKSK